jgi:hypothetical protein
MLAYVSFFAKLITKYEKSPEDPMDKFTKTGNKKKVRFVRIECFGSLR